MISVQNLHFHYTRTTIFEDFTWQARRGETWAVLGPSGCGKTTLLYLLAGLRQPQSGEVRINGEKLTRPRPQTGLILQDFGLLPWATVRQNAELGLEIRALYGADGIHAPRNLPAVKSADTWLQRLGLGAVADKYPGQLSGGQRQRTAIARTLALQPDLLLMDEPFSALDAPTRENLQNLTLELCAEQNLTLVTITHAIEEAAMLGRKILLLGEPPNHKPVVLENPGAGQPGHRNSAAYVELCKKLREMM
jgi:ABC-type nitrate/sulfonate/bicarbonate transport system ATPase subunit